MASKLIASELAKIERLNDTNYDMWSRKIRYGLIHDNLEIFSLSDLIAFNQVKFVCMLHTAPF